MKRLFSIVSAIVLSLMVMYAATSFPVSLPNVGNGRIVVCGQNAYNYFVVDLSNSRPTYHDEAGLQARTRKMVNAFRHIDADIYAICELEAQDSVLSYLTRAMNEDAGRELYAYVKDGISVGNGQIKSGYMYRRDRVKPVGNNAATSTQQYYRYTMRLQAFEELSSGERFVLSMNHFKAKDSTSDQGNAKRERNASDLIMALQQVTIDPDILLMGDLNCTIDENPLVMLTDTGYIEELLRFDNQAYTYYYNGYELIDHVFSNSSMSQQVTGAGAFHVNTATNWNSNYKYSDHDPYLVGLNLGLGDGKEDPDPEPDECEDISFTQDFKSGLDDWTNITVTGNGNVEWYSNAKYGACINAKDKCVAENWLISPTFDLSDMEKVSISIRHNIYYDNSNGKYTDYQTLMVSNDYRENGSPADATWTQVPISAYRVKGYTNATMDVPLGNLKSNFRYAFRYLAPTAAEGNYWEIDNTALSATCHKTGTDNIAVSIDLNDDATRVYTITGQEVTASRKHLPTGIYLLVNGTRTQKIVVR